MGPRTIEGTWEEISRHAAELAGRKVRLTMLDSVPLQPMLDTALANLIEEAEQLAASEPLAPADAWVKGSRRNSADRDSGCDPLRCRAALRPGRPEAGGVHERCKRALPSLPSPLLTTWPSFTEAMYLAHRSGGWPMQDLLWKFVSASVLLLHDLGVSETERMRRDGEYRDSPMDMADASLVAVVEKLDLTRIFTLDHHFRVYRPQGHKALRDSTCVSVGTPWPRTLRNCWSPPEVSRRVAGVSSARPPGRGLRSRVPRGRDPGHPPSPPTGPVGYREACGLGPHSADHLSRSFPGLPGPLAQISLATAGRSWWAKITRASAQVGEDALSSSMIAVRGGDGSSGRGDPADGPDGRRPPGRSRRSSPRPGSRAPGPPPASPTPIPGIGWRGSARRTSLNCADRDEGPAGRREAGAGEVGWTPGPGCSS